MENLVVTGATGFIGSHVVELLKDKYKVSVLVRKSSDMSRIEPFLDEIEVHYDAQEAVSKADVVIHLATKYIKHHSTKEEAQDMVQSNIAFPVSLIELCKEHDVPFINTGTFFEYGYSQEKIAEDHPKKPFNFYAATKIAFETILKTYDINTVTLRIFSPYGPRDNPKLMEALIHALKAGEHMDIHHPEQKLNWTYVKDIARAYEKAVGFVMDNKGHHVFNICSDELVSIRETVKIMQDISGKRIDVSYGTEEVSAFAHGDNTKAKEMLGWQPQYTLKEGLREML